MGTLGTTLTSEEKYEKYKTLLLEACQTYDAKARSTRTCHCATKALLHQMTDPNNSTFDVNTDVDMLMAYRSMGRPGIATNSWNTCLWPVSTTPKSMSTGLSHTNMARHPLPPSPYPPETGNFGYFEQVGSNHGKFPYPMELILLNHQLESPLTMLANLHQSQWRQLTPQEQVLWDQFSPESKKVITTPPKPPPQNACKPPPTPRLPPAPSPLPP